MELLKKRSKKKILFITIISIILIISLIWFYNNVIYFAHLSVISACYPERFEEDYSYQYVVSGQFSVTPTEDEPIVEIVFASEDVPKSLLKHELCHLRQWNQNRLGNCNSEWLLFLNEIECYSIQRFYELFE